MVFILGIVVGLLLAIICILSVRRFQTPIERTIKQVLNKTSPKGEIFGIEDTQLEDLLEQFKEK